MNEYDVKRRLAGAEKVNNKSAPQMTNGIPNSVLADVFSGKQKASSEMMGHRANLAPSIAAKMSQSFGMDVSRVQVYRSDAMAGSEMHGMAQGNKVVLSSDVDINTLEGQAVLGHELSHIRAQSMGIGTGSGLLRDASLEHQADTEGMLAARGMTIGGESMGMTMGLGMAGLEGLQPMGAGIGATAAAPMQADKDDDKIKELEDKKSGGGLTEKEENKLAGLLKKKKMAPLEELLPGAGDNTPDDENWATLQNLAKEHSEENESIKENANQTIAQQHLDIATPEQSNAYHQYILNSHPINSFLRGENKGDNTVKQQIKHMDEGMQKLGANVTTFRGVSDMALISAIKQDPKMAKKLLTENGMINYDYLDENPDALNGFEFTDNGYSSTSTKEQYSENWRKDILQWDATLKNEANAKKILNNQINSGDENLSKDIEHGLSAVENQIYEEDGERVFLDNDMKTINALDNRKQRTFYQKLASEYNYRNMMNFETEDTLLDQGYGSHLYEINVPKGMRGTMIDKMKLDKNKEDDDGYQDEKQNELLLDRGTRFRINGLQPLMDGDKKLKNQFRILMDVVSQKKRKL